MELASRCDGEGHGEGHWAMGKATGPWGRPWAKSFPLEIHTQKGLVWGGKSFFLEIHSQKQGRETRRFPLDPRLWGFS